MPKTESEFVAFAKSTNTEVSAVKNRASQLHELNPMLGHRGCRLGITHPEIYDMQVRSIFEAAIEVKQKLGRPVHLEIMIPLVATEVELNTIRSRIDRISKEFQTAIDIQLNYFLTSILREFF